MFPFVLLFYVIWLKILNTKTFSVRNSFSDASLFEAFYQAAVRCGSSFDQLDDERRLSVWVTIRTHCAALSSACAHVGIHVSRGLLAASITRETKLQTEKIYTHNI